MGAILVDSYDHGVAPHTLILAKNWITCACAQQDERLTNDQGEPYDSVLISAGIKFSLLIERNNILAAAHKLIEIEDRARYLLKKHHQTGQ